MAVYVDKLRDWGWKLGPSCHLISDAEPGDNEELHTFARKLGMKREWFQKSSSGPHYDLTVKKRVLAVRLGAVELGDRLFYKIWKSWVEKATKLVEEAPEEERAKIREWLYS